MIKTDILEKIENLEQSILDLKLKLLTDSNVDKIQKKGLYDEQEIIDQVKAVRKSLWDKKYAGKT